MDSTLLVDVLTGMTGGISSVLVGQPFDTVKVKMQLFPKMYKGMFSCISNTVRQQGFRNLYAGTVPALVSNCLEGTVMFGSYGVCQKLLANIVRNSEDTTNLNWIDNAIAGSIASIFTSLVICPTELVKIHVQGFNDFTKLKQQGPSINQVIKTILKTDGFNGLFRGLGATMYRESIGCFVFFGSYQLARELLKSNDERKENCNALSTAIAGSIAGMSMWLVVYPIDLIKSRMQMSGITNGFQMVQKEILNTGLRGLYCGLWPTLVKTIPVTGVLMFSVEFSKPYFMQKLY